MHADKGRYVHVFLVLMCHKILNPLALLRAGLGQTLEPRCSNPQGIYVAEEGSAVEVCFMVFRGSVPQMVTFSIEGSSNLGMCITRLVLIVFSLLGGLVYSTEV